MRFVVALWTYALLWSLAADSSLTGFQLQPISKASAKVAGMVHRISSFPLEDFEHGRMTGRRSDPLVPRDHSPFISPNFWSSYIGQLVKLQLPGIEHGYGKVIEVLDIPSR
jgi:hypothetical protein